MQHNQSQDLFNRLCAGSDDSASSVDSMLRYANHCVVGKLEGPPTNPPPESVVHGSKAPSKQPSTSDPSSASDKKKSHKRLAAADTPSESSKHKKPKRKRELPPKQPVLFGVDPEGPSSGESDCSTDQVPTTKRSKKPLGVVDAKKAPTKGSGKKMKKEKPQEGSGKQASPPKKPQISAKIRSASKTSENPGSKVHTTKKAMFPDSDFNDDNASASKNSKKEAAKNRSQKILGHSMGKTLGVSAELHRERVVMAMARAMLDLLN